MTHDDEQRQLQQTCQDLVREFADRLDPEEVQQRFEDVVHDFDGVPVRSFVPVLAGRAAREWLRELSTSA
jgi:hypothetical protein